MRGATSRSSAVYLFPGQGAYLDSVFAELGGWRSELGEVFDQIDAVLRETGLRDPISPQLFARRPPSLEDLVRDDPDLLQLALFGTSAAVGSVLLAEVGRPSVLVGHSLGEIAALTAAGALSVRDGAFIVAQRNAALRTAGHPGGMLALGVNARRASALVELMGDPGVAVAAENSPRQTVVSGSEDQLLLAADVAGRMGISATRLHSPYPFHSPLMAEASEVFERAIRGVRQAPLRVPVYSPISGRCYHDGDDLPSVLASHLTLPVRFLDAMRHVHGDGADVFVECGARNALSGLVAKSLPEVATVPCLTGPSPVDSLRGALSWLTGAESEQPARSGSRADSGSRTDSGSRADSGPRSDSPAEPRSSGADRAGVLEDLRALYAEAVEYPVEVFTEDVDLEADLGVDSVKQTELLARVAQRYGMPEGAEGIRVGDFPTLGHIADLVVRYTSAEAAVPEQRTGEVSPALNRHAVLEDLRVLYAEAVEYPVEVFTEDVDLEADLGVDSVKQTELLSRAARRYGMPERAEGIRVADFPTLGHIADLVVEHGSADPAVA